MKINIQLEAAYFFYFKLYIYCLRMLLCFHLKDLLAIVKTNVVGGMVMRLVPQHMPQFRRSAVKHPHVRSRR
jgi:hypothetical protein